jgi:hypothetical protein
MSQVFKPVSYTNLANLAIGGSTTNSTVWSPIGSKTCLRISTTADCHFRIDDIVTTPGAIARTSNPILTAGADAYITVNSNAVKISTIGPSTPVDDPIIQFVTDGGNESYHNFKIGDTIRVFDTTGGDYTTWNGTAWEVTKTDVNEAALGATRIAVATSGSTLTQSIGGIARLGFQISAVLCDVAAAAGFLSVTEVATTG